MKARMRHAWLWQIGVSLLICNAAFAQSAWPSRPVRFIVPFTPGSASDIVARTIGDKLSVAIAQPVVVDNRAGAGGVVGTAFVAKSDPDGHTFAVVSAGHVVNPLMHANLPYDALNDFAGVMPLASLPSVLTVSPTLGVRNVAGLIALARSKPGVLNYASGGTGSASHVNAEKFRIATSIEVVHVPLKGAPDMVIETIAGRTHFGFEPISTALPAIREGKLLALAVSSNARATMLPEIPTIGEAGVPAAEFNFWIGLLAPARTPRDIIRRMNTELRKIVQSPEVRQRLGTSGAEPYILDPEEFDASMRAEYAALRTVIKPGSQPAN
jgi:tripartite-type tricarboxylate transporter receptor subunit TctC